jgi:hypothetical protein
MNSVDQLCKDLIPPHSSDRREKIRESASQILEKMSQLIPSVPQEGERCRSYIAVDLACQLAGIGLDRGEIPRRAIVTFLTYHRYLEAFMERMEREGIVLLSIRDTCKHFGRPDLESYMVKALHLMDASNEGPSMRACLAAAMHVLSKGEVALDSAMSYTGCITNKTVPALVKQLKAKAKDLLKELGKQKTRLQHIDEMHVDDQGFEGFFPPSHHHSESLMAFGEGEGIYEFCGSSSMLRS